MSPRPLEDHIVSWWADVDRYPAAEPAANSAKLPFVALQGADSGAIAGDYNDAVRIPDVHVFGDKLSKLANCVAAFYAPSHVVRERGVQPPVRVISQVRKFPSVIIARCDKSEPDRRVKVDKVLVAEFPSIGKEADSEVVGEGTVQDLTPVFDPSLELGNLGAALNAEVDRFMSMVEVLKSDSNRILAPLLFLVLIPALSAVLVRDPVAIIMRLAVLSLGTTLGITITMECWQ